MSQQLDALGLANAVRTAIAEERRVLEGLSRRAGSHRLARLLEDPPEWLGCARLGMLVGAVRGFGVGRSAELLRAANARTAHVQSHHRVRQLTARQRGIVASLLRQWERG